MVIESRFVVHAGAQVLDHGDGDAVTFSVAAIACMMLMASTCSTIRIASDSYGTTRSGCVDAGPAGAATEAMVQRERGRVRSRCLRAKCVGYIGWLDVRFLIGAPPPHTTQATLIVGVALRPRPPTTVRSSRIKRVQPILAALVCHGLKGNPHFFSPTGERAPMRRAHAKIPAPEDQIIDRGDPPKFDHAVRRSGGSRI